MSAVYKFRKINIQILLITFLILPVLLFTSCINDLNETSDQSVGSVSLSGTINYSGAVPQQLTCPAALTESESITRTAFPVVPAGSTYEAIATATVNGSAKTETADITDNTYSFASLDYSDDGIEWTVTVKLKDSSNNILMSGSKALTIKTVDPIYHWDFILVPEESGNGKLGLDMTVATKVKRVTATCSSSAWTSASPSVTMNGTTASLSANSIAAGSYTVQFDFYSAASGGLLLYSDIQSINVVPKMTTNYWINNGSNTGTITGSGTYVLTDEIIDAFALNTLYVGDTDYGTAAEGNSGTAFKPFTRPERAFERIRDMNRPNANYTIYINGTYTGNFAINSDLSGKATSITIIGNDDGSTILDGHFTDPESDGTTLEIATSVPVIIKNISITGGNDSEEGGGLKISNSDAKVSLENGVKIYGNSAVQEGGGIYNTGTLYISSSTVIGNADATTTPTSSTPPAISTGRNSALTGAGIYSAENSKVYLGYKYSSTGNPVLSEWTGGIYYNWAGENNSNSHGGGIACDTGTLLCMASGTIAYNRARGYGGGIYSKGKVFIHSNALVGKEISTTSATDSVNSNWAQMGGGICCSNGVVWLGYKPNEDASDGIEAPLNEGKGLIGNFSLRGGGGIQCVNCSMTMASGNIISNGGSIASGAMGGGIWMRRSEDGPVLKLYGGTIANNDSKTGKGIESDYPIVMKGIINMPSTADNSNVIRFTRDTVNISIAGSIEGSSTITITPNSYATTRQVVQKYTAMNNSIITEATSHFKVTPQVVSDVVTPWYVNSTGYLTQMPTASSLSEAPTAATTPYVAAVAQADFEKIKTWVKAGSELEGVNLELHSDITIDNTWAKESGNPNKDGIGSYSGTPGYDKPLKAHINGNNHEITFDHTVAGLIGFAQDCVIENIILRGTINSPQTTGALAKDVKAVTIKNCINYCNVTATNYNSSGVMATGGIAGKVYSDKTGNTCTRDCYIIDCVNYGSVDGGETVGGVVGTIDCGYIINCENHGEVTGRKYVGGIVGDIGVNTSAYTIEGKTAIIENCCSTGKLIVTGNETNLSIGGIVYSATFGRNVIYNCCFAGSFDTTGATGNVKMGGINTSGSASLSNCYFAGDSNLGTTGSDKTVKTGSSRVTEITNTELEKLNNPLTNLTAESLEIATPSEYRKWELHEGKPRLVR